MRALASVVRTLRTVLASLVTALGARRRLPILILGLLVLGKWQSTFKGPETTIPSTYRITASTGISYEPRFFFFLYHLGFYPLTTDEPITRDTKAEAERLLHNASDKLRQDYGVTFRSGDRGRVYLYFVDAWKTHHAVKPSLKPAHALAFFIVLLGLFASFWWVNRPGFGFVLCVLLGSNPFQLNAVYNEENIFSWSITALLLVMALHVPLLEKHARLSRYAWGAAIATGILMGSIRTVRSEPMPVLLGAILAYVTLSAPKWKRGALVGVLLASFVVTNGTYARLIQRKFDQSSEVMRSLGQETYSGPLTLYHEFWHPIFCGLGDFDEKYGYRWDDRTAYVYALPILHQRFPEESKNLTLTWDQSYSYDRAGKYPVFFSETRGYHDIIREKVLGDIKKDPAWYIGILKKRVWRILTTTTPVSISFATEQYSLSGPDFGLLALPLLGFVLLTRRSFFTKLLLQSTLTSVPALLVFSDRGMTCYGVFHIVTAAILAKLVADGGWAMLRRADVRPVR